jgi:hypothetical protein
MSDTPRDLVAALEASPVLPCGQSDRFAGYGVLGTYFPSGDALALRRFAASSIGPAYTSVWHCDRTGRWVFYQDVMPHLGCGRYFTPAIDAITVAHVRIVWTNARTFSVIVGDVLEWRVELVCGVCTRLLNAWCRMLPPSVWQSRTAVRCLTTACGVLRVGRMRLTGTTPGGFQFHARPTTLWRIASSRAVIGGRDTGEACNPRAQVNLGDVWLPRAGLFAVASLQLTPPATTHSGR